MEESAGYHWSLATAGSSPVGAAKGDAGEPVPSQLYRFKEIPIAGEGISALATTPEGKCFCAAIDRGAGRIVYLSVPRGLGVDKAIHPVVPRLIAHLSRSLMPVEVSGQVEWLVNRTKAGWSVTLLNPSGQDKPQQGITPTDYRQNKPVTIRLHVAMTMVRDRLQPDEALKIENGAVTLEVPAGGVRIVELK